MIFLSCNIIKRFNISVMRFFAMLVKMLLFRAVCPKCQKFLCCDDVMSSQCNILVFSVICSNLLQTHIYLFIYSVFHALQKCYCTHPMFIAICSLYCTVQLYFILVVMFIAIGSLLCVQLQLETVRRVNQVVTKLCQVFMISQSQVAHGQIIMCTVCLAAYNM